MNTNADLLQYILNIVLNIVRIFKEIKIFLLNYKYLCFFMLLQVSEISDYARSYLLR